MKGENVMPNHIQNVLKLEGKQEDINALLESVEDIDENTEEIYPFSFNKIIPMPEEIRNTESGGKNDERLYLYLSDMCNLTIDETIEKYEKTGVNPSFGDMRKMVDYSALRSLGYNIEERKQLYKEGEQLVSNLEKYGAMDWYEWAVKNWGTKWNAYQVNVCDNTVYFQTAWDCPDLAIKKLAEKNPAVKIKHIYADENLGYNCGSYVYENGKMQSHYVPEGGHKQAYDVAISVWGNEESTLEDFNLALNKTKDDYVWLSSDFDVCDINGKLALCSDKELTESEIPDGLYLHICKEENTDNIKSVITREPLTRELDFKYVKPLGETSDFASYLSKEIDKELGYDKKKPIILKIKDVLPEMSKNENIIESCEMINNHPSIVIFGKNTGVRYGYVGYDPKDKKIAEKCEDMTFDKEMPIFCIMGKEDILDNIFCKTTGNELSKMSWISYDCGHSGETYDEKSVREYYPQDAESIIERNEWRNSVCGDYSPAVRSLIWCKDANKTIIDVFESERTKEKKQPEQIKD